MVNSKNKSAFLILIFGAVNLGFAPIFVKFVGLKGTGLTAIAFWRMIIAGIVLFILCALRKKSLSMNLSNTLWAALAGFLFALDLSVWHRSIMFAGAGLSTILGNTQVFITAILSFLIFKEKLSIKFLISITTAMLGVVLLSGVGSGIEFTDKYILGVFLGLLTAFCYSAYLLTLKKVRMNESTPQSLTFIAWICLFSAIFMGVGSIFESGNFIPSDLSSWFHLIGLAVLVQVFGWWAIFYSLSKIRASRAGLVLLLQPTLATVWGYLLFKENLTLLQILGGVITLGSIYYEIKSKD